MESGASGRPAAVDPRGQKPRDQRGRKEGEECNEEAEEDQQRHPADAQDRHVQLGVDFAVRFVVVVRRDRLTRRPRNGVFARVFPAVVKVVQVLQRARSQAHEAQQQQNGRDTTHEQKSGPISGRCQMDETVETTETTRPDPRHHTLATRPASVPIRRR